MANEYIRIGIISYEKVKNLQIFKCFSDKSQFYSGEIKCRLKAGNSCYYSVQTLLVFDFSLRI